MAVYVGIDVHKRFCQAALMDENGTHVNVQIGHYQEDERNRVLSIVLINSFANNFAGCPLNFPIARRTC
ncbi:MAG: hypothetical protein WB643_07085 [Candidatus Bathyarchaeia archaeon]